MKKFAILFKDIDLMKTLDYVSKLKKQCKKAERAFFASGASYCSIDWKDHEKDLKKYSKENSKLTIKLLILDGEEYILKTFKNGKFVELLVGNDAHKGFYTAYKEN